MAGINSAGSGSGAHFRTHGNGYAEGMSRSAESLSPEAMLRRRLFVAHYVKTLNATSSAIFAGYKSPGMKGNKLLKEPYVQHLIREVLSSLDEDAIMTQNEILFQLKFEALNLDAGNQSARIAALAHLAKIRGMMIDRSESKLVGQGGVLVVPAMLTPTEWSKMAEKAQADLKESVRD